MTLVRILVLAVAMAAGTWLLGWWSVPLIAALYSVARPADSGPVRDATIGAVLAWGAMLAWHASNPAFGRLSAAIGGIFPVPAVVVMFIAVLFAAALAASAARVAQRA